MKIERWIVASLVACGCPADTPPSTNDDTGTSSGGSSDEASASTTEGPDATETSEATDTDGLDSGTDTGTGTDTDTGLPEECGEFPPPEAIECQAPGDTELEFSLIIDETAPELGLEFELDEMCVATSVTDDGVVSVLQLGCPSGVVEIEVTATPHQPIDITEGSEIALYYWAREQKKPVPKRRLTLRRGAGGPLAFAILDDSDVPDPVQFDASPLGLALPPTTCEPTFFNKFGLYLQAAALQVDHEGETVDIFEGGDASIGTQTPYRVLTDTLDRLYCEPDDSPGANYSDWYIRAMIFQLPER